MVFVTGGTGLVGARLIYDLINKGEEVRALKRRETQPEKILPLLEVYTDHPETYLEKIDWVEGDTLDVESLLTHISPGSDVYHCAAMISFSQRDKKQMCETNIEGTANMVNAALIKKVRKFCHVSSIGALGSTLNGTVVTEETPWLSTGKSAYSLSKYLSELEIWRGIAEGLEVVIVNPAVILGAGNWNEGSSQLFRRIAEGTRFYTRGSTSYVDVKDVSRAMIELMKSPVKSERFVLAAKTLTYQKLFIEIAQRLQVREPGIYVPPALTHLIAFGSSLVSIVAGKSVGITPQTARIAHCIDSFDGSKITRVIPFSYTPIEETFEFVARAYQQKEG